jgi:hypothetical protein
MTMSRIGRASGLAVLALALGMSCAAAAEDLQLAKADTTTLTEANAGKPFWSLQAQCAGIYGAGYKFEADRQRARAADTNEAWGVSMLNASLARLQADRSIDQKAAMDLAGPEVEYGRMVANEALKSGGTSPQGKWNFLRSTCEDIATAYDKAQHR